MSIATKTGDDGTTGILFGRRVRKTDLRIVANGSVDELNAALGLARAYVETPMVAESLLAIQKELVMLMGELATVPEDRVRYVQAGFQFVNSAMTERLTAQVHDLEQNHRISYQHWATPGATKASAFLDAARTVCRRAERAVLALREAGEEVNDEIVRYLNRLSDLCWLLARFVETKAGVAGAPEVT